MRARRTRRGRKVRKQANRAAVALLVLGLFVALALPPRSAFPLAAVLAALFAWRVIR